MSPQTPSAPSTRNRRTVAAGFERLDAHREGARLLSKRQGSIPVMEEVRARPGAIRPRDRLFFFRQLAVMLNANVPVAVALAAIAKQCDRARLREVLLDVVGKVESGQPLSSALQAHLKTFPSTSIHLTRAGEASGDLAGMMMRICELIERDYEMKKKIKSALTYPAVMLLLAASTVVALFVFILPKFRKLYAGKEEHLPTPTRILLTVGDVASTYGVWIVAGIVALVAGLVIYVRTEPGRSAFDTFLLRLPVVGGVVRRFSLARSIRTMGALLQSGVPVLTTLELARDLSSNRRLSEAWEYVRKRTESGGRIHDGMTGQSWFPGTLVQMTAMGEAGGILDDVLVQVGEFYDREAELAVSDATALIEPLMVVAVGGVVGFIASSIMLPIFNMSKLTH